MVSLEFNCAPLPFTIYERRQHARVPVLSLDLHEFIMDKRPSDTMDMSFLGSHYGSARKTVSDLFPAAFIDKKALGGSQNAILGCDRLLYVSQSAN